MSEPTSTYQPRCIYLTCKELMVYGEDFQNSPEFEAGMIEWQCLQTCSNCGPDSDELSLEKCSNPERPCFQEF